MKRKILPALIPAIALALAFSTATFAHDGEKAKDKDHDKSGTHKQRFDEGSGSMTDDEYKSGKDRKDVSAHSDKDRHEDKKAGDKKDEGSGSKPMKGN